MEIYLFRHGIADAPASGVADADRALTAEGREKLNRVLNHARAAGVEPTLILSSPLKRALQTAEMAAEILTYRGRIVRTEALLSEAAPEALWEELRNRRGENAVLAAGHEPHLSMCAAYLLGCTAINIDMKKGALLRIDVARPSAEPQGVLKWMLTPALAG